MNRTVTIKFTPEELKRIDEAWKYTPGFTNRTQYLRAAINKIADNEICTVYK